MSGHSLTPDEVRSELALLDRGRAADDFRPLALFGTGPRATIAVEGAPWEMVPVRGELDLRRELVARERGDTLTVFLVDFTEQLPLDVSCRLRGNTVHRVTVARRLAHRFGARGVAPGLAQSAVARWALTLPDGHFRPVAHPTLLADDLWEAVLAVELDAAPPRTDEDWLHLVATGRGSAALRRALTDDPQRAEELDGWLAQRTRIGAGGLLRRVWAEQRGVDLLGWLLLLQAARSHAEPSLSHTVFAVVEHTFDKALADPRVHEPMVAVLDPVLQRLRAERHEALAQATALAEQRASSGMSALARHSRWLRAGYVALRQELATALDLAAGDASEVPRVWHLVEQLGKHHHTSAGAITLHEHAARLATWCAWRAAHPLPEVQGTWTDLTAVAVAYRHEGGHVDWCRAHLRAHATTPDPLDEAVRRLIARADEVRDADDHRFATALIAWHEARQPSRDVLPLNAVVREIVVPFLAGNDHRKLLVVLMDGMSRANLAQLLQDLDPWLPLSDQNARPVLASLPTLTGVSRSAVFAGKDHPSHVPGAEGEDPNRWARNPALKGFAGPSGPALVVKRELTGEAPLKLAQVLAGSDRVAGVVVNAVDDDLSGAQQLHAELSLAQVPVLSSILRLAADHRWAVLLVADHGHVSGNRLRGRKRPGEGGQRYRTLGPADAPLPEEMELPPGVWRPRGTDRIAAFWREDAMWGATEKGAHGGLALSEVVVPCVLLAPSWLGFDLGDPGLRTVNPQPPKWWASVTIPAPRRPVAPKVAEAPQPSLFPSHRAPEVEPGPATVEADADGQHPLVAELAANPLFRDVSRDRESKVPELLSALDVLLRAPVPGQLPLDRFAEAMGTPRRRVPGLIGRIQFFQLDGVALIEANQATELVTLHVERLKRQYELKG